MQKHFLSKVRVIWGFWLNMDNSVNVLPQPSESASGMTAWEQYKSTRTKRSRKESSEDKRCQNTLRKPKVDGGR